MNRLLFLSALLTIAFGVADASSPMVVCYFPSWSHYRDSPYTYEPNDVPAEYCTHIIWTFVTIGENNVLTVTDEEKDQLKTLLALKSERPDLKVLASVGGAKNSNFSDVARNQESIDTFANVCLLYVKDTGIDGLDIDWEYPTEAEKEQFTKLLQAIRESFDSEPGADFLLGVALGARKELIETTYDIPGISKVVDIANLMTYDLHGHWDQQTGHQAALYPLNVHWPIFSQDWVVSAYLGLGLDASKATLGIPMYGRVFKLCDSESHDVEDPSCEHGYMGPASKEKGILFFYEICHLKITQEGWTTEFDNISAVPYSYKNDQWITHENIQSVTKKVAYIKEKNLAGAMIWDVSQDDFSDMCGGGKYPLLSEIAHGLGTNFTSKETTSGTDLEASAEPEPEPTEPPVVTPRRDGGSVGGTEQLQITKALVIGLFVYWGAL